MSRITLDKQLGVNCRLTFCPRCKGDTNSLSLLGNRNFKTQCTSCNAWNYGSRPTAKCGGCRERIGGEQITLEEYEKVPGALCETCEAELVQEREQFKKGAVAFRCEAGCSGLIKGDSEFAIELRENQNTPAPKPIGVQFSVDECPNGENHK